MENPFSIEGKTIFVTGASSGIGRAIAIECSKMKAKLIISGRSKERLQETFFLLDGEGHMSLLADLTNPQEIKTLLNNLPSLDGIVHCAGFTKTIPFQFINEEDLLAVLRVNFISPTIITQTLLKNKKINKGASLVFISSISGVFCSSIAESIYSASKGAVNGVIKAMAIELATKNIRVNSINPGVIETSIFSDGIISTEQLEEGKKKYPLKRYGKPTDVAYASIYLLSDASNWITGINLVIDGGYTLL